MILKIKVRVTLQGPEYANIDTEGVFCIVHSSNFLYIPRADVDPLGGAIGNSLGVQSMENMTQEKSKVAFSMVNQSVTN